MIENALIFEINRNSHPWYNHVSPYGAVIPDLIRDPQAKCIFAKAKNLNKPRSG